MTLVSSAIEGYAVTWLTFRMVLAMVIPMGEDYLLTNSKKSNPVNQTRVGLVRGDLKNINMYLLS